MSAPLVSVIIPCFNAEQVVADAVSSALAQTYENTEIIVVDDGSTDRSLAALHSFGERLRLETGPRGGAGAARNRGLALARGEFVQFLDADDLIHPRKIEIQVAASASLKRTISVCWGSVTPNSPALAKAYSRECDGDALKFVTTGVLQTSAPLHRVELLREIGGFDPSLPCAQERDLHLRLACNGVGFSQLRQKLFTVRLRPSSVSSDATKVLKQRLAIVTRSARLLESQGRLDEVRREQLATMLARSVKALLRAGETQAAQAAFDAACQLHPRGALEPWARWARPLVAWLGPRRAVTLADVLWR